MTIAPQALLDRPFEPVVSRWDTRDTILYALGCGLGTGQLRYTFERAAGGLQALPSLVNVLGYPGFWADAPDTGIDWRKLVHIEQAFTLARPLAVQGEVTGRNRVVALLDKGAGRGAIMVQQRELHDAQGALVATVRQTVMLRGDGGFAERSGSSAMGEPLAKPHAVPERAPDAVVDQQVDPRAALIYRLSGDFNPLHADPEVARAAGFPQPILHGMCTMGMALHAALQGLLGDDASRVAGMRIRFTAPVFPGEALRTELWNEGGHLSLRTRAVQRDVLVLDGGRVDLFD